MWPARARRLQVCYRVQSEAEGPVRVEQAGRVLQVHVVASRTGLAVATLEKKDLLGDTGGDGRGQAALPSRNAGKTADIRTAGPENATQGVAEHLIGDGGVGRYWPAVGPVSESREEWDAMGAALGRVALFGAEGGDPQVMCGEPVAELVEKVQSWVDGASNGWMVSFALAVVFAAGDVYGCSPMKAGNAVPGVEVEPEVAELESNEFGHAKAADGGECDHEAISVVASKLGSPAEHGGHQEPMHWEEEGSRAPDQAGEAPSPSRELAEASDGRA